MIRVVSDEIFLFFLPFICFALWLLIRNRAPFAWVHWEERLGKLAFIGLVLAASAFVYEGLVAKRNQGTYVPAHMENGHLVPGEFENQQRISGGSQ